VSRIIVTIDKMLEQIEAVTAEQVRTLPRGFIDPNELALAMLGRLEGFRLRRSGPCKRQFILKCGDSDSLK
jgi:hypothetical protein